VPPGPGRQYGVHFCRPGPGVTPSSSPLAPTLGSTHGMRLSATTIKATKAVALLVCGVAAIYGLLGALQAASLYQGSRALWNQNLWLALTFLALVVASLIVWPGIVFGAPRSGFANSTYFWLAVAMLAACPPIKQFLGMDACLDAGGSYDSIQGRCSMTTSHPYIPMHRTQGLFMVVSAISLALALLSYVWSRRTERLAQSAA
jgi:hypothetical protein